MTDKSVEQANDEAQANSEGTANEADDLDAILSEFETESSQEQTKQQTHATEAETDNNPKLEAQVAELLRRQQEDDTRSGIGEALGWAKEVFSEKECEVPEDIDEIFEGRLDIAARKDPRIAKAFLERKNRPAAWKKIVVSYAEKLSKSLPKASKDEQREEIAAAVALSRGGTKKTEGAQKWLDMSDREFDAQYRRAAGLTQ